MTCSCLMVLLTYTIIFDVLLHVTGNFSCLRPSLCKQTIDNESYVFAVNLCPDDPFSVAKTVQSSNGSLLVLPTSCNSKQNVNFSRNNDCTVNCSSIFLVHQQVLLNQLHVIPRAQSFLDQSLNQDVLDQSVIDGLQSILRQKESATNIFISSSHEDFRLLPSAVKSLFFTSENGSYFNETLESIYNHIDTKTLNFVVYCSVICIADILFQAEQFETKVWRTQWVVIPTEGASAKELVNITTSAPNADIVVIEATPCSNSQQFQHQSRNNNFSNLYKMLNKDTIILKHVGNIDPSGNITVSEVLFARAKYGFNGKTLTVSTLEWDPFVIKEVFNGTVIYKGLCMDLLEELSRALNFSYRIVEPEDKLWGTLENGKWTGLIGQAAYKKVDLVVAPISVLDSREEVMDFTSPYFNVHSGILLKVPDPNANKWLTLVSPFRYEVHICILFSLIFSTVFLFVVEEVNPMNRWTDNRLSDRRTRYGDILWYHFGALMANGGAYLPNTQSGRTILSCWWLFTVISAATYSGNLIAFLTDWRDKLPFNSLAEMVQQDTYSWGTMGGAVYITMFQNSNRPEYRRIWNGMRDNPASVSPDVEEHRKRVTSEFYAYLGAEDLYHTWKLQDCGIHIIHDPFLVMNYAVGLPNNSVYTSVFSEQILRINEMGLPRLWYNRWKPADECETSRSAKRVDVLALQSAFYAAGAGVLIASVILISELLYRHKCRKLASGVAFNENEEDSNSVKDGGERTFDTGSGKEQVERTDTSSCSGENGRHYCDINGTNAFCQPGD